MSVAEPRFIETAATDPIACLLFAPGASAPMTSDVLECLSAYLSGRRISVLRFEFRYMAEGRAIGKRRPPPNAETLVPEFAAALQAVQAMRPALPIFIGGKSLGGRVASLLAAEDQPAAVVAGVVCIGYPFHPARRPEKLRTAHLATMTRPMLVVQGQRDAFGNRAEVAGYGLSPSIEVSWIEGGDHDFAVPKRAQLDTLADVANRIADFISPLAGARR